MRALAAALLLAVPAAASAGHHGESAMSENMEDKAAINAAVDAVYAVISGPVGQPRDWDAMRALFLPDAKMTALRVDGFWSGSVEDYIERSGPFLIDRGFTESALVNRIEVYGDIAHAWSSYAGTWTNEDGSAGSVRGINSFQLMRQEEGRWLVQSIYWQAETPGNPLPADMEGK